MIEREGKYFDVKAKMIMWRGQQSIFFIFTNITAFVRHKILTLRFYVTINNQIELLLAKITEKY